MYSPCDENYSLRSRGSCGLSAKGKSDASSPLGLTDDAVRREEKELARCQLSFADALSSSLGSPRSLRRGSEIRSSRRRSPSPSLLPCNEQLRGHDLTRRPHSKTSSISTPLCRLCGPTSSSRSSKEPSRSEPRVNELELVTPFTLFFSLLAQSLRRPRDPS